MLRFILSCTILSLIVGHVVETTRSLGLYELQSTDTTHSKTLLSLNSSDLVTADVQPVSAFHKRALKIAVRILASRMHKHCCLS